MLELTIGGVMIFSVLEGVVKLSKKYVSKKYLPLLNVLVAESFVLLAIFGNLIDIGLAQGIFVGLVYGLALGGFFNLRKSAGLDF